MKKRSFIYIILLFVAFSACKEEPEDIACLPPDTFAGDDQSILGDTTELNGSFPAQNETAKWVIISASKDYRLYDRHDPQSLFIGEKGGTYQLKWKITKECGEMNTDTINLFFACDDINVYAGEDVLKIKGYTANLNANTPEGEQTGRWEIIEGEGGSFEDESDPQTLFTSDREMAYTLTWNVTNKCLQTMVDTVKLSFLLPFDYDTITDVEGNRYKTVVIGEQTWMAENLKTTKYTNTVSIGGAMTWYNHDVSYKNEMGGIYVIAYISSYVCPSGWHVPSEDDWNTLIRHVNPAMDNFGWSDAGKELLSRQDGGTDTYGFTAVKAATMDGDRNFHKESLDWWTTSSKPSFGCVAVRIKNKESIFTTYDGCTDGKAIRCVKD